MLGALPPAGTVGVGATFTVGTLTGGFTDGVVTVGTVTFGTVTVGTVTFGTVTVGTETVGVVTFGTDSVGTDTDGTLTVGTPSAGLGRACVPTNRARANPRNPATIIRRRDRQLHPADLGPRRATPRLFIAPDSYPIMSKPNRGEERKNR